MSPRRVPAAFPQVNRHDRHWRCLDLKILWRGRCPFVVIQPIMATRQYEGIDAYLAGVPATHRAALKKLRGQIKKLHPKATEHISYGMPLFKLHGHPLAGFRAAKRHFG